MEFQVQRPVVDPAIRHRVDPVPGDHVLSQQARNHKWCRFWLMVYREYTKHAPQHTKSARLTLMHYPKHPSGVCDRRTCAFVVHDDEPVYVCIHTGMVHLCSQSCDRLEYLQHYNVKRCPISGREFSADYEDDDSHNRAVKRSTTQDTDDAGGLFAESTVRNWQRQENKALFHQQCVRVNRANSYFPVFPLPQQPRSPSTTGGDYDNDTGITTDTHSNDDDDDSHRITRPKPSVKPRPPRQQQQPVVQRRSISRVAKASLVQKPETRTLVSNTWKTVLEEFFPDAKLRSSIQMAYLSCVQTNLPSSLDVPLFASSDALNEVIDARIRQNEHQVVFVWLFRYLWFTWVAVVGTPRYQQNQFSYQPDNHATAVIRYLATGYTHNGRQVVPQIRWFGETAVDIKVHSHSSHHNRTHTVRRNLTRSTAMFMRLWNEVSESHLHRLPLIQASLHPFF